QGGIYDPAELATENLDAPNISQHVIMIHSDLGTGDQLHAVQLRCSIEAMLWDRFQHAVFIPGLFHLRMACAEAIWHCFIQPPAARMAAKGKRKAAPNHWPTDTEVSKDDQGGLTNK
ncbi:hypothetical protein PAXRUDRAFT_181768, partial [Paxillus rubicundulus Ve08.2h10]